MKAIEELSPQVGTAAACRSLDVPRATLYRHRRPKPTEPATTPRPTPPRALCEQERQEVLDVLHSEPFADQAPAVLRHGAGHPPGEQVVFPPEILVERTLGVCPGSEVVGLSLDLRGPLPRRMGKERKLLMWLAGLLRRFLQLAGLAVYRLFARLRSVRLRCSIRKQVVFPCLVQGQGGMGVIPRFEATTIIQVTT
jgi:hypothetical protein